MAALLERHQPLAGERDFRRFEWHYLARLCRIEPLIIRDTTEINSVEATANAMLELLNDPEKRKLYTSKAYDVLIKQYTDEGVAKKLTDLYWNAIIGKSA